MQRVRITRGGIVLFVPFPFFSLSLSLFPFPPPRTRESRKNIRFEWRLKEYLKIIVVERALEIKLAREFYILKLGNFRSV